MIVALIDHYDSFSYNVIDWLAVGVPALTVAYVAGDDAAALAALARAPVPLVLSPGPKRPEDAPMTVALARSLLGRVPILGICLGHQILASLAGAAIVRSAAPFHGATRAIRPTARPGLLAGLDSGFRAALYNSLVAEPGAALAPGWVVSAHCDQGEIQALSREVPGEAPAYGVQFHPESFLSEGGPVLRRNWVAAVSDWAGGTGTAGR